MKKSMVVKPTHVKKPVGTIHVDSGELTLTQKKIFNLLLWHYFAQDTGDATYTMPMTEITKYMRYDGRKDAQILASLKKLARIQIEWNLLRDNERDVGFTQLLGSARIIKGNLRYSFPPELKEILLENEVYSLLNLDVVSLFRSKYSLALYENCYRFIGTGTTGRWSVELFRELVGVPKKTKKYDGFGELKRSIIDPSIKEINDISNIEIEAHYMKFGKRVRTVEFSIKKKKSTIPMQTIETNTGNKEIKKMRRKVIKIKKKIDGMAPIDREKFMSRFYEEEIKKSAVLLKTYEEDGLDEFLIERKIKWFEENLLNVY